MIDPLVDASIGGAVAATVVWLLCRVSLLSPAARATLWWLVTVKFVVALLWFAPVRIPVWPAAAGAAPAPQRSNAVASAEDRAPSHGPAFHVMSATAPTAMTWRPVAIAVWGAVCLVAWGLALRRWRRTCQIVRTSTPAPPEVQAIAADLAARMGGLRVPRIHLCAGLTTPLVTGIVRPVVVLPSPAGRAMTSEQVSMAICHELVHLRRGDLLMGTVPAMAEMLFFFHPLARLAAREYALWREAACDAAVVDLLGVTPRQYGQLLVQLGVSRPGAGLALAEASWSMSQLKRRLVVLAHPFIASTRSRIASAVAIALVAGTLVPVALVARQDTPAASQSASQPRFVLFDGGDRAVTHGSSEDAERARRVRNGDESLLWFRIDGREYVTRDPAALRQIAEIWHPVDELGSEMGRLGARQGDLGARMGEYGARQGELGARQGRLGAAQARIAEAELHLETVRREVEELKAGLHGPADDEARERLARRTAEEVARQAESLARERRNHDEQMRQLDRMMRELDAPMRDLDRPMRDLDVQMRALDERLDAAAARAAEQTGVALGRFVASGVASAVD